MRFCFGLLAVLFVGAPGAAGEDGGQDATVGFLSGERLKGKMTALSPQEVALEAPLLLEAARFPLAKVRDITLAPAAAEPLAGHDTDVTLVSGDTIRGKILTISEQVVSIETAFAGRMDFKRAQVAGIGAVAQLRPVFRGPTGLEGWVVADEIPPPWRYGEHAFQAAGMGSIGRDELLAEEVRVSFEISWQGAELEFRVVLFANDTTVRDETEGYRVTIRNNALSINYLTEHLGSVALPGLERADHARVELLASRRSGLIKVRINDQPCDARIDLGAPQRKGGKAIVFESLDTAPKELRAITVKAWDGEAGRPLVPASAETAKGSRLELVNGDTVQGRITAIRDGTVTLETAFGRVDLPAQRFRMISLNPNGGGQTFRYRPGDVRCWFADGSSLVFRLEEVNPADLTGSSPAFGTVRFKVASLLRLEFNLDQ